MCGFFKRRQFGPSAPMQKAARARNKTAHDKAASKRILQHQTSWRLYSE